MTLPQNVKDAVDHIYRQREEILSAFIAKYGFDPELAEQVEQTQPDFSKTWHVRRLVEPDVSMKRTLLDRSELAESRLAAANALLKKVYDCGENMELHEQIRAHLGMPE